MSAATASAPPAALPPHPEGISATLKDRSQWVGWTFEQRDGHYTKPPISPVTGNYAASTDATTWATFPDALRFAQQRCLPGVGFVVTGADPFIGIDLDKCRDPKSGDIEPWAAEIIDRFDSCTEVSPSGTGVRIFIQSRDGLLPDGSTGRRKGPVEVYGSNRYFTVTGHQISDSLVIADRTAELAAFHAEVFGTASAAESPGRAGFAFLKDEEVVSRARDAANGSKFVRLWAGDTSEYGGDDSRADQALLGILAFWTQDVGQLDRLFRGSGLYRAKWERADYRDRTIARALARSEVYEPKGRPVLNDRNGANAHAGDGSGERGTSVSFVSGARVHDSRDYPWPEMGLLPAAAPSAPTLPAHMVPAPLRSWVCDIANLTKLPVEMIAAPAIVAAGSLVGRAVGLRPGRYDDFTVVPALWGALIARPGWMKSAAIKEAFRPIGRLAAAAHGAHENEAATVEVTRERIGAEIDAIKRKMRDTAKKGEHLGALEAELADKRAEERAAVATERRYLTHDATVEKLGELLRDNPRGLLGLRDELSGWLRAFDKPGREGDREFFLEAWNGTGSFTTDRIGRGTIHIPALTLSLFGGIQPGKLAPLVASAIDGGIGDDGLLQRFQVTVWPDRLPPWTKPNRWPDSAARDRAAAIFEALAELDGESVGAEHDDIPFLRFSPAAQMVSDDWRDALEHRLRSDELDATPAFAAHMAKYRSLMPGLALLFHLIDWVARSPGISRGAVGEDHARLAADWCGFLGAHARKLYAVELHAGASAAHAIAVKIRDGAIFDGQSVRELYRAQWAGLKTPERVLAGLTELTELGWVRVEFALTGGRSSQVVRLHPDLSHATDTSDERDGGRDG